MSESAKVEGEGSIEKKEEKPEVDEGISRQTEERPTPLGVEVPEGSEGEEENEDLMILDLNKTRKGYFTSSISEETTEPSVDTSKASAERHVAGEASEEGKSRGFAFDIQDIKIFQLEHHLDHKTDIFCFARYTDDVHSLLPLREEDKKLLIANKVNILGKEHCDNFINAYNSREPAPELPPGDTKDTNEFNPVLELKVHPQDYLINWETRLAFFWNEDGSTFCFGQLGSKVFFDVNHLMVTRCPCCMIISLTRRYEMKHTGEKNLHPLTECDKRQISAAGFKYGEDSKCMELISKFNAGAKSAERAKEGSETVSITGV